jgi:hypothetical protein
MNKRKLEPKDICGYLPHGLYVDTKLVGGMYCNVLTGYQENGNIPTVYIKYMDAIMPLIFSDIKPLIRPISDLYKTITHNGKEIIPIIECAKIALPKFEFIPTDSLCYCEDDHRGLIQFYYENNSFVANFVDIGYVILNQVKLFDYLNELKIDYRGLIDADLAIDCNSTEFITNPYNK